MPSEPLTTAPGDVDKSSPKTPLPPANLRIHCQTTTRGCRIAAAIICPSGAPNPRPVTIRGTPAERSGPHTGDAGPRLPIQGQCGTSCDCVSGRSQQPYPMMRGPVVLDCDLKGLLKTKCA